MRAPLEVADVYRTHGLALAIAHCGHLSPEQLKVMSAVESCRSASF